MHFKILLFAGNNRESKPTSPMASLLSDSPDPLQVLTSLILAPIETAPQADPLSGLDTRALGDDIEVIVNEQSVSFRISSEIIFAPGQADMSLEGLAVLRKLLPVLRQGEHRIVSVRPTHLLTP